LLTHKYGIKDNHHTPDAVRFANGDGVVDTIRSEGANLETGEESIGVFVRGRLILSLNWQEADGLRHALQDIVDIARHG
jgi:hypothetical protein